MEDREHILEVLLEILELYHSDDLNVIMVKPESGPLYYAVMYLLEHDMVYPIGDNRYLLG